LHFEVRWEPAEVGRRAAIGCANQFAFDVVTSLVIDLTISLRIARGAARLRPEARGGLRIHASICSGRG
jgi:hypothetical protein